MALGMVLSWVRSCAAGEVGVEVGDHEVVGHVGRDRRDAVDQRRAAGAVHGHARFQVPGLDPALPGDPEGMSAAGDDLLAGDVDAQERLRGAVRGAQHGLEVEPAGLGILGEDEIADVDLLNGQRSALGPDPGAGGEALDAADLRDGDRRRRGLLIGDGDGLLLGHIDPVFVVPPLPEVVGIFAQVLARRPWPACGRCGG